MCHRSAPNRFLSATAHSAPKPRSAPTRRTLPARGRIAVGFLPIRCRRLRRRRAPRSAKIGPGLSRPRLPPAAVVPLGPAARDCWHPSSFPPLSNAHRADSAQFPSRIPYYKAMPGRALSVRSPPAYSGAYASRFRALRRLHEKRRQSLKKFGWIFSDHVVVKQVSFRGTATREQFF